MAEPREPSGWTDRQVEMIIGNLLRTGVLLAAAIVLCGGVIFLVRHGAVTPDYHLFRGEPSDLCSPKGIVSDAVHLSSRGIIQLGFLLLIATPVLRVAACSVAFACQRDRLYVVVSLIVLGLLLYSLLVGSF
jgi:uncharacterized membrane protein